MEADPGSPARSLASSASNNSHWIHSSLNHLGAKGKRKLIRGAMIEESTFGCFWQLIRMQGSVFPSAFCIAMPCALVAAAVKELVDRDILHLQGEEAPLKEFAAWTGFSSLIGFLVVFRTNQAYARFWEGCRATQLMRAEWFDACSSLVAFCKHSKAGRREVLTFQNIVVRLFSMMHAAALATMEDTSSQEVEDVAAFTFELIDIESLDEQSLCAVRDTECKVELIMQWIQCLIVDNIDTGVLSIPPPILSRAFNEIANGMVAFHEATNITAIPFPFPYTQTCDALLYMHWAISPFVVQLFVNDLVWAAVFAFIQVFVLWSLNFIALEIENPFGMDMNDLDGRQAQVEMNAGLVLLLEPESWKVPHLVQDAVLYNNIEDQLLDEQAAVARKSVRPRSLTKSMANVWDDISRKTELHSAATKRISRSSSAPPTVHTETAESDYDSENSRYSEVILDHSPGRGRSNGQAHCGPSTSDSPRFGASTSELQSPGLTHKLSELPRDSLALPVRLRSHVEPLRASAASLHSASDVALHVAGAGVAALNGSYGSLGTHGGRPTFSKLDVQDIRAGTATIHFSTHRNQWEMCDGDLVIYRASDEGNCPPEEGWSINDSSHVAASAVPILTMQVSFIPSRLDERV